MKTVGILTFHRAWNYGACLQAFSTRELLVENGFKADLIDYCSPAEQAMKSSRTSPIKGILLGKDRLTQRAFESGEVCAVTTKPFTRPEQLDKVERDVLLAGSDQIWNPKITGGLDEGFYLQRGSCERRVSFASSLGSHTYEAAEQETLRGWFERFDAVSVRDYYARSQVQPLTKRAVEVVNDPTLMFSGDQWRDFTRGESPVRGGYVLTYFVGQNFAAYRGQIAPYLAKLDLPVYNIQVTSFPFRGVRRVLGPTLREFVRLIDGAAMIVTDSFHGTAFSINLGRPFIAVDNPHNPRRVKELLWETGLEKRRMPDVEQFGQEIDFANAHARLAERRRASLNWLLRACDGE